METAPLCSHCNRELTDWQGNVMVDNQLFTFSNRVAGLRVICKECTRELDAAGSGKQFHSIWELRDVKKHPIAYFGSITQDLLAESEFDQKWDADSVREVGFLVALTLPYDAAKTFLRYFNPSEWDDDGTYIKRLKERHGKDIDE